MKKISRNLILLGIASLSWPTVAASQQAKRPTDKAITYAFVSPNTSEGLKLDDAVRKLDSKEERTLIRETHAVACRIGARPRISKSLGNWSDGAENSTLFRIYADKPAARYAVAWLGKFARQKAVLYFRRDLEGKARMYVMAVTRPSIKLAFVSSTLDQAGISYRTLVQLRHRVVVYIVDLTNELRPKVQTAALLFDTSVLSFAGSGELIGDDHDRDKAQRVFAQEISRYESTHPPRGNCLSAKQPSWKTRL